jgi:hypothetical protein
MINNIIYINILSRDGSDRDKLKLMDIRDMRKNLIAGSVIVVGRNVGRVTHAILHGLGENPDPGHLSQEGAI